MLALVTASSAVAVDPDLQPLVSAFEAVHVSARVVSWDDLAVDWGQFEFAIIRSTWNYVDRLAEFQSWLDRVAGVTRLANPLEAIRWSLDKHYLAELGNAGVPVVATLFVEVGDEVADLDPGQQTWVVKPVVGASSHGVLRCEPGQVVGAVAAIHRMGRAAMVQPYLDLIDNQSETSLVFLGDGAELSFSHAVRKDAILSSVSVRPRAGVDLHSAELVGIRSASDAELALADRVLLTDVVRRLGPLAYARVDVVPTHHGPALMELELVEPSLYFGSSARSVQRAASTWKAYVERDGRTNGDSGH